MAVNDSFLSSWDPRLLSVLRIAAAFTFLQHGSAKLLGFPKVEMFANLQLASIYGLAGLLELVGGILLLIGLLSRPVAFVLSGMMAIVVNTPRRRLSASLSRSCTRMAYTTPILAGVIASTTRIASISLCLQGSSLRRRRSRRRPFHSVFWKNLLYMSCNRRLVRMTICWACGGCRTVFLRWKQRYGRIRYSSLVVAEYHLRIATENSCVPFAYGSSSFLSSDRARQ